ncbi:hypothetical protein BHJ80_13315 [Escherichia coli]|nr:hypothetical protein BHJ80_13315 [Escherichia coli]
MANAAPAIDKTMDRQSSHKERSEAEQQDDEGYTVVPDLRLSGLHHPFYPALSGDLGQTAASARVIRRRTEVRSLNFTSPRFSTAPWWQYKPAFALTMPTAKLSRMSPEPLLFCFVPANYH